MPRWFDSMWSGVRGRPRHEPARQTFAHPTLVGVNRGTQNQRSWKPTPRNLRYFSRTPYARRAINAIKGPIVELGWEIGVRAGVKESPEIRRQIEIATYCFANPNAQDSFRTMIEQVVEDVLIGAGAIEVTLGGDAGRPLWMWPTDGLSIQVYPGWGGGRNEARYAQSIGYGAYVGGGQAIDLTDEDLIYIRPNPSTATPFGLGPLEVAFVSISRQLGVGEFAGNLATNAKPSVMIDLGEGAAENSLSAFRSFWTNEIEGQGKTPIIASKGAKVHRLYPEGDEALYLKWQEFLKAEIAVAFDLSPQNLGVERDVNRNTGEVAEDRDWDHAIKPRARELASYLTRHALHRRMGFHQLEFHFLGLDREDEKRIADIFTAEFESGATTPNEYRESRGKPPLDSPWANLTGVDLKMAQAAAAGAKTVYDPSLPDPKPGAPDPAKKD